MPPLWEKFLFIAIWQMVKYGVFWATLQVTNMYKIVENNYINVSLVCVLLSRQVHCLIANEGGAALKGLPHNRLGLKFSRDRGGWLRQIRHFICCCEIARMMC